MKLKDAPVSEKYLENFIEKTIGTAERKESNTMFYLPGTGRNSLIMYASRVVGTFGKVIYLRWDSGDERKVNGTWKVMASQQGVDVEGEDLEQIVNEIIKKDRKVMFLIKVGEPDLDWKMVRHIKELFSYAVDFNFGFGFEQSKAEVEKGLGDLAPVAMRNWWYLPLLDNESSQVVVKLFGGGEKSEIVDWAGGYPRYIRALLRKPKDNNEELDLLSRDIWEALSGESRVFLMDREGEPSEYLQMTGLVKKQKDDWKIFSPIFEEYVAKVKLTTKIEVKEKDGVWWMADKKINEILSTQELACFMVLWGKRGEVVEREDLAKALWGELYEDKYSDWAISQVVRRMRVKLGDVNETNKLIETIRDKGVKLNA